MVKVDKEKCIGCGLCTATCADCFELGKDGKSQAKGSCKGDETCIKEAISGCPAGAISE